MLRLSTGGILYGGQFDQAQRREVHNLLKLHGGKSVEVAPEIIEWSVSSDVVEGETVNFFAKGVGNPPPDLLWDHDGREPRLSALVPVFRVGPGSSIRRGLSYSANREPTGPAIWMADIEMDQAGEYRLTASNELGSDETTIPLSIRPRPATPGQPDLSFFAMPPSRRTGLKAWPAPGGQLYLTGEFDLILGERVNIAGNVDFASVIVRHNWDGALDRTFHPFSESGYEILDRDGFGIFSLEVHALAFQPDGKLLLGGLFQVNSSDGWVTHNIVRIFPDGRVDRTFALDESIDKPVRVIEIAADGSIVVAGEFTMVNGVPRSHIASLDADGTLLDAFNPEVGPNREITYGKLDSRGRFIFGGDFTETHGESRLGLARMLPDGTLDSSFQPPSQMRFELAGLALTETDGVLVAGIAGMDPVVRLLEDGSLDPSFSVTGPLGFNDAEAFTIDEATGEMYLAGPRFGPSSLVRLNADGSMDSGFSPITYLNDPSLMFHPETGLHVVDDIYSIRGAVRVGLARVISKAPKSSAPRILHGPTGGAFRVGDFLSLQVGAQGGPEIAFQWFKDGEPIPGATSATLTLDRAETLEAGDYYVELSNELGQTLSAPVSITVSKGAPGTINYDFDVGTGLRGTVRAIEVMNENEFIVAGSLTEYDGVSIGNMARLSLNGELHETFGRIAPPDGVVESVAALPDGRVLIGGSFIHVGNVPRHGIALLEGNGEVVMDVDLGVLMEPHPEHPVGQSLVRALEVDSRGRIYIGGDFSHFDGDPVGGIVRLRPDLTRDVDFDTTDDTLRVYDIAPLVDGPIWIGVSPGVPRLLDDAGTLLETPAGFLEPDPVGFKIAGLSDGSVVISGREPTTEDPRMLERWSPVSGIDGEFSREPTATRFLRVDALAADREGGVYVAVRTPNYPRLVHIPPNGVPNLDFLQSEGPGSAGKLALLPDGDLMWAVLGPNGLVRINGLPDGANLNISVDKMDAGLRIGVHGGAPGAVYTVERTSRLKSTEDWSPTEFQLSSGETILIPSDSLIESSQFYRVSESAYE